MKISYNWLKEFINIDSYSPEQIAEALFSAGFEVSELTSTLKPGLESVISAKVIEVTKHPSADNLSLCRLTDGKKEYPVVCGAKNVAEGNIVALAMPGSILPGDVHIKETTIRGVKSEGMICSSRELGIDDEHAGIMHLDSATQLGQGIAGILDFDDYILNVEIHANRSDCLGHLGLAREIAAKLGLIMHYLPIHSAEKLSTEFFPVEISNTDLCSRYIVNVLSDLKVGPSINKIKLRLKNCGLRPINSVVDITNYVLLEFGHPLHAFDLDKLNGQKIFVRNAVEGESLEALDGRTYKLNAETLVIADSDKPIAIAGIIGGAACGVTETTKKILLESAVFNAVNIRLSRQRHQIITESSYRFERSLSWEICQLASQRAVFLLGQHCSANFVSKTDVRTTELKRKKVMLRPGRVDKILSLKTEKKEIAEILTRLGMTVTPQAEHLSIEVPSWRIDIEEEIDLIEDIARQRGYDKIPSDEESCIPLNPRQGRNKIIKEKITKVLHTAGFYEAINNSMVSLKTSFGVTKDKKRVEIENPISQEYKYLRTSLAAGLISNVEKNISNQNEDIKLYEFGNAYFLKDTLFEEEKRIGLICTGNISRNNWKYANEKIDFYFISGIVDSIFKETGLYGLITKKPKLQPDLFHPGKSAAKFSDSGNGEELPLCEYGMINPGILGDMPQEIFYAEFFAENIFSQAVTQTIFEPYLNLPRLKRDLSFIAPEGLPYENILNEILACQENEIKINVLVFDLYKGEKLPEDKHALGLRLTFNHKSRTLEDAEINTKIEEILIRLKKLNVCLRNA